ncbi:MAG: hypothetical protein K8R02_04245 [Anaerohalosphaeraceae bacterium]|nr:hypothetical protein [Anaerohalosphaeraceae bacterium]
MRKNLPLIFCILGVILPLASADVSEHVFLFDLWYEVNHSNPEDANDVEYEFYLEVETDDTVSYIEFSTPGGFVYEIPNEPQTWDDVNQIGTEHNESDWGFWSINENYNDLDKFGDGIYTFTIHYEAGGSEQTTVTFLDPCTANPIAQPMQVPQFISPQFRDSVSSPFTISWQSCTDPNVNNLWVELRNDSEDTEYETSLPKTATSWGPFDVNNGYWKADICFDKVHHIYNNEGIEVYMGKCRYTGSPFAVGLQWIAYEVWAGDTDYTTQPQWWEYYHNIDKYDYVKLGQSLNGEPVTVSGDYTYYVIASREPVFVDAVQGSTGAYYYGGLSTGGTSDWNQMTGEPNDVYAQVGEFGFDGSFCGFARLTNPGDWDGLTVITDITCSEPLVGDLDGDCRVNFTDFAMMAENWLECNLVPADACW